MGPLCYIHTDEMRHVMRQIGNTRGVVLKADLHEDDKGIC